MTNTISSGSFALPRSNIISLEGARSRIHSGAPSTVDAQPTSVPSKRDKSPKRTGAKSALCKTRADAKKTNDLNRETRDPSRMGYAVTHRASRPSCTILVSEEFRALVEQLSVRELRARFPHEHSCHTAMLNRAKHGKASVHSALKPFKSFLRHLGQSPSPTHTVGRIHTFDNEYSPEKVRWATKQEQANNRSTTIKLPFRGEEVPLTLVAKLTRQKPDTMRKRLRDGWRAEEAVAGRRFFGKAPLTKQGWPAGATVSKWDGPYKGWIQTPIGKDPGATRAVYFAWIAGNIVRQLDRQITAAFPQYFDPENMNPDDDSALPPEETNHPTYQNSLEIKAMIAELMVLIGPDPHQYALYSLLRRDWPYVLDQKKARDATKSPQTRFRYAGAKAVKTAPNGFSRPALPPPEKPTPELKSQTPITAEDFPLGYDFAPIEPIDLPSFNPTKW